MALAESILFVGKAVATVKDPPDAMKREHLKLLVALQHRQQPLDRVVQQLRKTTADWLFSTVLVKQHGLPRYFASFRNMFLLGYGALACNFIDACTQWRQRASLASKSVSTAEKIFRHQEFNALLAKASVGTEAEDALDGYGVKIVDHASGVLFSDLLLVDVPCILRYELQWPIDLFLSQSVIHQYSKLWSYLIGLKHVQVCLCESFLRTSQHAIWRLRSHMLYWVNALWSHVQANVIDVHYQNLMDTVSGTNAARDFEQLQMAHADYLQHVTRGCLLLSAECVQCIQQILRACLDFCQFVKQINETWRGAKRRKVEKTAAEIVREWTRGLEQKTAMATATDQVDTMEKDFIAMTSRFFDLLTHASPDIKASGNLDMLLMQLDYNKYYSGDRSMRVLLP
ncbi:Spc98 family-domain-containing protein [Fennellomyces sp. T-0311]|nr:Spc98 family-domain-containing protein [Fennellomyces sp. T-0311]